MNPRDFLKPDQVDEFLRLTVRDGLCGTLSYLKNGSWLTLTPDLASMVETEASLDRLWSQIEEAGESGDFRPRTSRLCDWCDHQALCPAFGGTPPEYPGWPGTRVVPAGTPNLLTGE